MMQTFSDSVRGFMCVTLRHVESLCDSEKDPKSDEKAENTALRINEQRGRCRESRKRVAQPVVKSKDEEEMKRNDEGRRETQQGNEIFVIQSKYAVATDDAIFNTVIRRPCKITETYGAQRGGVG